MDSSDAVQETFLEAQRNFSAFRGVTEAEFVAWLRGILAARIANLLRHFFGAQGRDIRRERDLNIDLDQSSRSLERGFVALQSTPSQHLAKRETGVLLADAIAKLPEDYREVILMRHFEELPFSEIATRMQRSVDAIQKLWVRGLARLRQLAGDIE